MQNDPRRRFLRERFSPEGWLGLHLTIGVIVVFLSTWAFAEIGAHLGAAKPLALLDQRIVSWFHRHATPLPTVLAVAISFCGSVAFLTAASITGALALATQRMWNRLLVLVLSMAGGSILNIALKHAFHRQRPVLENPLVTLSSYGFPSGHTMGATVFYGLAAIIATHALQNWKWRSAIIATACVIIAAVGLSRVYLGAHYPSDVVGAFVAGLAWLAFCWTGLETIRRRKAHRRKTGNVYAGS
jgi:membrane-associated phospholipid phosphatase